MLYKKFRNFLNRTVHFQTKKGSLFELGDFFDLIFVQIPYFSYKKVINDIKKWDSYSLRLANESILLENLNLHYGEKSLFESDNDYSNPHALYPINLVCLLVDFLYAFQKKRSKTKTKIKIVTKETKEFTICRIKTTIPSAEHWFFDKNSEMFSSTIKQLTNTINLHSPFTYVERLSENNTCLIVIKFDSSQYLAKENRVLDQIKKHILHEEITFTKNENNILYGNTEDSFIKVVDSRILANKRNSLFIEYSFLNRIKNLNGFPKAKLYSKIENFEILVSNKIDGIPLSDHLKNQRNISTELLLKIFDQIRKLSTNFIAHCDLKDTNILISPLNDINIIDFDQALINTNPNTFTDIKNSHFSSSISHFPILKILSKYPSIIEKIQNIQESLKNIWEKSAKSQSNSPGDNISYYSYSFGDRLYSGERDFFDRWILLEKNNITIKNKSVVELGCNLGLFGAYSSLYGARDVKCFDIDKDIIECAKNFSKVIALNNISHQARDLNIQGSFSDIDKVDFMFALSIYYWLKDKTEFDRLMMSTKELIYEGHEQHDIELDHLKKWKFSNIKVLGTTERLRTIFYASRD